MNAAALIVKLQLLLVFHLLFKFQFAIAGTCWLTMLPNGRCSEILYERTTKEVCCGGHRLHTAWSSDELDPSTFFFWRVLGDGVRCSPCKVSCKDVDCGVDRTCVIRKDRPKCVCSSKCKEGKIRAKRGPICGTDGRSYRNICRLRKRACRRKSNTLSIAYSGTCQTSCDKIKCPSGMHCLLDQNLSPHCVNCSKRCSDTPKRREVCGSDGLTYPSACHLREKTCKKGKAIPIAYKGPCRAESDDDCPGDKSQLPAIRLRKHLLCDYDKNTRPVRTHTNAVSVYIQMILKYYQLDMHENSFTVDSWMALRWADEHLKWNPDDYDSLKKIHLSNTDIWIPDLSVYNRRTQGGDPSVVESTTCIVSNEGQVTCVPSVSHSSLCTSDLTRYPFDTHNCTVRFGSWIHSGEELDLQVPTQAISTSDLVPNSEWQLEKTYVMKHPGKFKCCPNNTYPSINFSFLLARRPGGHAASVILPALALIVITLISLWISPTNPERLRLCYLNLLCEFLNVQYVSWMIPLNGDKIPLILIFARDSLLLSTFTVVFSLILKTLVEQETPAPTIVSKIVCILTAFKPGQIIFVGNSSFKGFENETDDDSAAIINNQDKAVQNNDRLIFAKILDRLCFLIYLIIYICMFAAFTP